MNKVSKQVQQLEEIVDSLVIVKEHRHEAKIKAIIQHMKVNCQNCPDDEDKDCPCQEHYKNATKILTILSK